MFDLGCASRCRLQVCLSTIRHDRKCHGISMDGNGFNLKNRMFTNYPRVYWTRQPHLTTRPQAAKRVWMLESRARCEHRFVVHKPCASQRLGEAPPGLTSTARLNSKHIPRKVNRFCSFAFLFLSPSPYFLHNIIGHMRIQGMWGVFCAAHRHCLCLFVPHHL